VGIEGQRIGELENTELENRELENRELEIRDWRLEIGGRVVLSGH
jgi:hypothetical protein